MKKVIITLTLECRDDIHESVIDYTARCLAERAECVLDEHAENGVASDDDPPIVSSADVEWTLAPVVHRRLVGMWAIGVR